MPSYSYLSQRELLPLARRVENASENKNTYIIMEESLGQLTEQRIEVPNILINKISADLHRDCSILVEDGAMMNTVNICAVLAGQSAVHFKDHNVKDTIEAGSYHGVYVPENQYILSVAPKTEVVHIAIDRSYFADMLNDSEGWSAMIRTKLLDKQLLRSGSMNADHHVQNILSQIMNSPLTGQLHKLLIEAKVMELVAHKLETLTRPGKNEYRKKDNKIFHELRAYLDSSFTQDHSLRGLCKQFGLNEFRLKQGFKATFGKTVFDYIHDQKMQYAWQLLNDEGKLVNEVAGQVGYRNSNHFSVAFKKRFGISPIQLRGKRIIA